jgi:hypothetical protein
MGDVVYRGGNVKAYTKFESSPSPNPHNYEDKNQFHSTFLICIGGYIRIHLRSSYLPIQCGFAIYGIRIILAFHRYQIKRTMIRKTNEQKLRSLIKNLHTIEVALLVERIETMMKLTLQDIEEKPESYDNWFVSHHAYVNLANKVIDQLKP